MPKDMNTISHRDFQSNINQISGPQRCSHFMVSVGHVIVAQRGLWTDLAGRGLLTLKLSGCGAFVVVVVMLLLVGILIRLQRKSTVLGNFGTNYLWLSFPAKLSPSVQHFLRLFVLFDT
ncbi:hypothetical protein LOAG_07563 [Loa loa]|uniref:Uncharacterized protein n=1 Tax=Loa loa TaxID=7209 RepID=A0A1S0TVI8_LOALO|nr:hypothetical protein LOAG_07563 [Loa loa]EFO20925.1 hypothetical protein LOAG_07563 [Loa loa]